MNKGSLNCVKPLPLTLEKVTLHFSFHIITKKFNGEARNGTRPMFKHQARPSGMEVPSNHRIILYRLLWGETGAGVAPGIFRWGADSSHEGAKLWFSGYYKCQRSPKKSLFTLRRVANLLRRGAIAPSPPLGPPLDGSKTEELCTI